MPGGTWNSPKEVLDEYYFPLFVTANYGIPATPGIETRIAHFNTRCCVYISISHNALASGKRQKARALYNCSLWWSYQDSFYDQQVSACFYIAKYKYRKIYTHRLCQNSKSSIGLLTFVNLPNSEFSFPTALSTRHN